MNDESVWMLSGRRAMKILYSAKEIGENGQFCLEFECGNWKWSCNDLLWVYYKK